MAGEAVKEKGGRAFALPGAYRVMAASLVVGLAGIAAGAALSLHIALGFAVGFSLGAANMLLLFRIARRGLAMAPEKATRYVAVRYHVRFLLMAAVFFLLISRGVLAEPWSPLAGLTLAIFTAIATTIVLAKEEVR